MKSKEKHDFYTTQAKIVKISFSIFVFLMFAFFVIGEIVYPDERQAENINFREFESEWQQILEDGSRISVEVPGKIPAEYGELITLTTTLPQEIEVGEILCFRPIWQDVEIYIEGEMRAQYDTNQSRPFGTNSAFRYIFVELEENDEGKELVYKCISNSKYTGTMQPCYISDKTSFWIREVQESGVSTVIAVFLLLMSLFCIITCVILRWGYKKELPLVNLAWAMFLCAMWMLSEVKFRQLLIKNVSILSSCTYWCLMLIPIPLVTYMNCIQRGRYKKVYAIPLLYSTCVLFCGSILQIFDVVQFVEQLPYIHGEILVATACIVVTITIDLVKRRIADYLLVGIGIYGMLLTAVLELILYYMRANVSLGTVLAIGLIFLLVMAIFKTGQDFLQSEQKKQQAITAREAQAKFLANMSHEIRTPINAVIGMNEMILRECNDTTIREYASDVKSASNMLLGLVNDILDFSKIESGQLEVMEDYYEIVPLMKDEILLLKQRASGKPITIQIDIDSDMPSIFFGDELRIKQILTNLASNAVKYTREGKVTIKAYLKWLEQDMAELVFSVSDTGIGIKKEDLEQLFESFKRLDLGKNRTIEGTGLGLNITKQLVELMNGKITVASEYGKGSTFTVSIPQKVIDKTPIGDFDKWIQQQKKTAWNEEVYVIAPEANILVIDDNPMNLAVTKGLLKRTQVKLDTAASGMEGLAYTKTRKYDMILLDHMMPDMDGVETLHRLRSDNANLNRNTVVVALTANAVAGCREMYLEYGFDDYIAKPIEANKLDELLRLYLPKEKVHISASEAAVERKSEQPDINEDIDLLAIDKEKGLSYCLNMENLYQEVLQVFCKQGADCLTNLKTHFEEKNWEKYAIVAHALKGNALNIGAINFSNISLQHERAGKEKNIEFLEKEYEKYITTYKQLLEKVEKML